MPFKSFYWPDDEEARRLWKEAKEIARREGKSVSLLIREFLEQYVRLHEPGNPQQRLDTIIKLGKKYVAPKICEFKDCYRNAVAVATFLNHNKDYFVCDRHLKEIENYANWKVKKFLE